MDLDDNRWGKISPDPQEIKDEFEREVGYWSNDFDLPLLLDPDFFDHYRKIVSKSYSNGPLSTKEKELILIAVNCSPTHLYPKGIRTHVQNALDEGATFGEIKEVMQKCVAISFHSLIEGLPDIKSEFGIAKSDDSAEKEKKRVKDKFMAKRGYWSEFWEDVLDLDPEYLELYTEQSAHPYEEGPLEPKMKEFIAIANDVSTTHLYTKGLQAHIRNARELGATREEILEVVQLVSTIGIQSLVEGAPILFEEAEKRKVIPDKFKN